MVTTEEEIEAVRRNEYLQNPRDSSLKRFGPHKSLCNKNTMYTWQHAMLECQDFSSSNRGSKVEDTVTAFRQRSARARSSCAYKHRRQSARCGCVREDHFCFQTLRYCETEGDWTDTVHCKKIFAYGRKHRKH